MGVKISSLPVNALPYTGAEQLALVQGSETKAGTLSSFVSYLSGALLSDSELRALSGNWQNTYTTFTTNSANYAVKNADNNFTNTQTISVVDTTKIKFGSSLKSVIDQTNGNIFFGYNATSTSEGSGNIKIGLGTNSTGGSSNISIGVASNSTGSYNIVMGSQTLGSNPMFGTYDASNIAIGDDILTSASTNLGNILIGKANISTSISYNNIVIGRNSGCDASGGYNNVVIGVGSTSSHNNCILFGYGATTTADYQLALGGITPEPGSLYSDYYLPVCLNGTVYYILLASMDI